MDILSTFEKKEYNKFTFCHLSNNKLSYIPNKIYTIDEVIENLINTTVLIFNFDYALGYFIQNKKYLKYFENEKLNNDLTTYICFEEYKLRNEILNIFVGIYLLPNLPQKIKYIKFHDNYNHNIDNLAESKITHIIFGNDFNCLVQNFPWTIEYLYFGNKFNQKLEYLPNSLIKLIFNPFSIFNQELDLLPNSIEYLFLPVNYSQKLNNLPNSLLHLELEHKYPHTLNNLPKSLSKFIFYYKYESNNWNGYNCSIIKAKGFTVPKLKYFYTEKDKYNEENEINVEKKVIWIEKVFVSLPPNLKFLDLTYSYKLNLLSDYIECISKELNPHIKKEMIKSSQVLNNLPPNLEVLKYPSNYNLIFVENIPQNIIRLFFSNKFNKSIDKLLNPNFGTSKSRPSTRITHLVFGEEFNQTVEYLPETLTNIYFGSKFNKSIDALPNSIQVIVFGNDFNNKIVNLPYNIKEITFGYEFEQIINFTNPTLKKITLPENFNGKKIKNLHSKTKILLPEIKRKDNKYYYSSENDKNIYSSFDRYKNQLEFY